MTRAAWLAALFLPCLAIAAQQPVEGALPQAVVDEVLRVWNAERTLRVEGPYLVEGAREVEGDLAVLGGTLDVAGHVAGQIVAINASVRLSRGARVDGGILAVGGSVEGTDDAKVGGPVRVYRARLDYARDGERLALPQEDVEATPWWRRPERWRTGAWSDLRLLSARTYNRVEGLPVQLGPSFGRDLGIGRLTMHAYGILRSADGFEWKSENVGHSVKADLSIGHRGGLRIGGRLFDVVEPVEAWQLSDSEVGLATLFLHRDYRDYYNAHGGALSAAWFLGSDLDVTLSFSDQRWGTRRTRDPWTIFRNQQDWRPNPDMDEGPFHLLNTTLRYDTRTDTQSPRSGWYVMADYEYGRGTTTSYAPTSPLVRDQTVGGRTTYDRLLVDLRRYNRISPSAQLNFRVIGGGWLSGDDLPLQRRFSLGGPGSLPGYDFRRSLAGRPDVYQCSVPTNTRIGGPFGVPAQCERFMLGQVEYRGELHIDPFGVLDEDRDWRRRGWGRGTQWVLFADVGRGWLVGEPDGELFYGKGALPSLKSFRGDLGLGLVLDDLGVYLAKSVTDRRAPLNVFVRLSPRF